jgi:hypothetical protein
MNKIQIVVILCGMPWIIFMSFIARSMIASWRINPKSVFSSSIWERIRLDKELHEQHPHIAALHREVRKWLKITVATWMVVFASMVVLEFICVNR